MIQNTSSARIAAAAIAVATAIRILFLLGSPLELSGDEAQYWVWAQHLSAGYFSKPPLIAFIIAASTALLGDAEWAIRLPATLFHAGTAALLFRIGRDLWTPRHGLIAALIWISAPGVWFSAVVMSTDAPLLFFAALTLFSYLCILRGGGWGDALILGIALALGFLSKLAMIYAVVGIALHLLFHRQPRDRLIWLAAAAALALALDLPNVIWNLAHDGANYEQAAESAAIDWRHLFHPTAAVAFALAQFGVFGPIALGVMLYAVSRAENWRDPRVSMLLLFAIPVLALLLAQSLASRAFANWAAMAYVPGALIAAAMFADRARWLSASLIVNILAGIALYGYGLGLFDVPLKTDPRGPLEGWRRLAPEVSRSWAQSGLPVLIAIDRNDMAKLIYYMRLKPGEIRMLSIDGHVHNSFDILAPVDAQTGAHALLFTRWPQLGDAGELFARSTLNAAMTQSRKHGPVLKAYLFEVADFHAPG